MRKDHPGVATLLIGDLVLLACVGCETSTPPPTPTLLIELEVPLPTPTPQSITLEECRDRQEIGTFVTWIGGPTPETRSGVLEQRVLQDDLVVWTEVVKVEFKAVKTEAFALELKRSSMDYHP